MIEQTTDRDVATLAGAVLDADEPVNERTAAGTVGDDDPGAGRGPLPGVGTAPMTLRQGLRRGGPMVFVVLVLLNSLDELEAAALSVLAPDIADTFGISDGTIVFLTSAAGAFIVLGALPMGWLADRYRRGPIVAVCSLLFSAMLAVSGAAVNAFMFFWGRFFGGVAKSSTGPVHQSMLADAYPIEVRGRLASATGVAGRVTGTLSPLVVGAVAAIAGGDEGWRWAFPIVGIPVAVCAGVAFFLPEPPRGQFEKATLFGTTSETAAPAAELPVSIEAGFARLNSIKTLRTVVLAMSALGFGIVTLPVLANLYIDDRFGLDALERGWVGTIPGLAAITALPLVGRRYDRLFRENPSQVLLLLGGLTGASALLVPVQMAMPNIVLFTVMGIPQAVLIFSALPMAFTLLQAVVPYRLRGLGSAMGSVYVFFIGATGGALASLPLTDAFGPRATIIVLLVPATVVGGLLMIRGSRYVNDDLAMVAAELREEHEDAARRAAAPEHIPVLQVAGLDVSYGSVQVLFGVGFEVHRGEVLALLGTNGAGKSTVLRAVAGLITPQRGVIRLHGQTITFVAPEQRTRLGIVSLAGGEGVFPSMTVSANLEMATFVYRGEADGGAARIARSMGRFPRLAGTESQLAGSLSGGQQQMLALAMALVHDPEILMIDELSLGLAPAIVAELLDVVDELRAAGLAMVIVEQSLNVALDIADRAIFLEKGQVRFAGAASELAGRDDLARAVFLGTEGG